MLNPSFKKNNIPIIFSSDNNYIKYLIVAIKSLICNSSKDYNYDIYILETDISDKYKQKTLSMQKQNVKINFVNVDFIFKEIDKTIFYLRAHFKIATYFRFFIPRLFQNFEKVLYIDSDVIILDDVAKLYEKELHNNYVCAAKIIINPHDKKFIDYLDNKLSLRNKYNYFQAGVLVFDIKKLLDFDFEKKCIDVLQEIKSPRCVDQCIMNVVLEDKVQFFSQQWNIMWHIPIQYPHYEKQFSEDTVKEYKKYLDEPKILHYTSAIKPWSSPFRKNAYYFWKYAVKSPSFNELLFDLILKATRKIRLTKIICSN